MKRQKLDEHTEEHILVGYDLSERNYRLRVGKTKEDLLNNEIVDEVIMNQETSTNKQYNCKEDLNKLLVNSIIH
ncbi:hypothetical protein ROZALSC1DRAFT_31277 [Rozella allomycis CSF55]|uniref:Uncharacterized protein n=1 Tax=Rozella allomycis (strain CSF55) TaxID=988480 RepID=A0A075B021_ROZAC|nr:hypothetical protein O9G_006148 [Rozella allomycis CSF55]RKP16868.1 hypothetical protein ROZALSC1DRAFT_31277 [Rozella allomycis CSF55]|eukprot:EPZ35938.1 hypothetical protein O9G_006148 [Rozella allomycis CSF55]